MLLKPSALWRVWMVRALAGVAGVGLYAAVASVVFTIWPHLMVGTSRANMVAAFVLVVFGYRVARGWLMGPLILNQEAATLLLPFGDLRRFEASGSRSRWPFSSVNEFTLSYGETTEVLLGVTDEYANVVLGYISRDAQTTSCRNAVLKHVPDGSEPTPAMAATQSGGGMPVAPQAGEYKDPTETLVLVFALLAMLVIIAILIWAL